MQCIKLKAFVYSQHLSRMLVLALLGIQMSFKHGWSFLNMFWMFTWLYGAEETSPSHPHYTVAVGTNLHLSTWEFCLQVVFSFRISNHTITYKTKTMTFLNKSRETLITLETLLIAKSLVHFHIKQFNTSLYFNHLVIKSLIFTELWYFNSLKRFKNDLAISFFKKA